MDPFEYYRQLRNVKRYVKYHINEPIALDEIAQQADVSKAHFSRMFHRHTGMRFQDWLIYQRVEYAKQLLASSDTTITRIAFSAGFGSLSAFERGFKKLEGATPRSFRVTVRKQVDTIRKQTPNS